MNRLEAVVLLLVILAAVYALMYFGWWRRTRRHQSATVATRPGSAKTVGAVAASAQGTYISTTTDQSRFDRVATGGFTGLGVRSAATMRVDGSAVTFERQGADDIRLERDRLEAVRRDRGMAGKFIGQDRVVVVTWRGDGDDQRGATDEGEVAAERFDTGFLPRHAADAQVLIDAVDRMLPQHSSTNEGDQ